ncbi:MAG: hypothetical protein ACUVQ6_01085 [Dissulfurimicrobium sp.]
MRPVNFSSNAIDLLINYTYSGNVREFEHIIQRIVPLIRGDIVRSDDLS